MADQENTIPTRRPQREAKIRAVAALCEQRKRKRVERVENVERVALGDLTNKSEKHVSDIHKQKKRNITKSKSVEESPVPENLEVKSEVKPEDPQLCGPYVSDIYDYLRNLEVLGMEADILKALKRFITKVGQEGIDNLAIYQLTRYKPAELKECVLTIHDLYLGRKGGSLQAVRDKYKQHKFKCVATTPSPPEIPLSFFEFREADP
ncbi:hypothetical protein TSUD_05400 [Trifolium subterraneum]|uniref:Cyclin C-terminal domain-containing protein n=1 Tax=Trifolium subterraneum TaxID=3900 RepID=A0A2Z6M465_TRISU|nr:hypothetical protein TSUD_05400 [Trifolium subterraneum]